MSKSQTHAHQTLLTTYLEHHCSLQRLRNEHDRNYIADHDSWQFQDILLTTAEKYRADYSKENMFTDNATVV